jgi:aspartate/methionine/tyrosine aminotransferase
MPNMKHIDASLGDPIFPFRALANHAFKAARKEAHNKYQLFNTTRWNRDSIAEVFWNSVSYLKTRGIQDNLLGMNRMFPVSGGTTRAFEIVMEKLSTDIKEWSGRMSMEVKPVIIMPTPTYGYFFEPPKKHGIDVVKVPRDMANGGKLDLGLLDKTMDDVVASGRRVVAYYDSNPHNPLGLVREESETRAILNVLNRHEDINKEKDLADIARKHPDKNARDILYCRGDLPILKIDDMVYDGLEYEGEKPCSFGEIENNKVTRFDPTNVVMLFGVSKAGFVTARAGLMVGDSSYIQEIAQNNIYEEYFPSPLVAHAMAAFLSNEEPHASARATHFKKMNTYHQFAGKFMKVLINGLDKTPEVTELEAARMVRLLMKHCGLTRQEAKWRLARGVENVKVITSPKAGFFHMLDFGYFKDSISRLKENHESVETKLSDIFSKKANIKFATGGYTGLGQDHLMMRATYAMPLDGIIDFVTRIDAIANPNPFDVLQSKYYNSSTGLT